MSKPRNTRDYDAAWLMVAMKLTKVIRMSDEEIRDLDYSKGWKQNPGWVTKSQRQEKIEYNMKKNALNLADKKN